MITDTTSAREIIERFVKINPTTDRIIEGHFGSSEVESQIEAGGEYADETISRLERRNRAFEARIVDLERELKQKDRDYTGVALEYQDLADENRRLKQELEIKTVVADARDATIRELRAELNTAKALER